MEKGVGVFSRISESERRGVEECHVDVNRTKGDSLEEERIPRSARG